MSRYLSPIFLSLYATIFVAAALLFLSDGLRLLDTRFYYPPQEALAFFYENPASVERLRWIALVDLLLFIPAYSSLLYQWSQRGSSFRLALLIALSVAIAADCTETILIWIGLGGHGWESGALSSILSLATPLKWSALALWGALAIGQLFRDLRSR
jgi:hypothetical protein